MTECVVFIESNTSGTGRLFALKARDLGLNPVIIAEHPARYPYIQQENLKVVQHLRIGDLDQLQLRIADLGRDLRIAGIYSSSEYFIETSAELARRFNLPGLEPGAVRLCRHKGYQRECLQQAGVGVPQFCRAASVQQAIDAAGRIALPVVIKPVMGSGSVGVRLCRSKVEVRQHVEALLAIGQNERGMPVPHEVLVEEYVDWPEFSAECFGHRVLGVTRKHVSPEPYFVETGHDFPAALPTGVRERVVASIQLALQAVRMNWGPVHVEFRCTPDGCSIMEINPRLAGGFIPELVRLATGVDLIRETISLVTGRKTDLTATRRHFAGIRFICPQSTGRIAGFGGIDEAASVEGICSVQMYKNVGDSVTIHHDFRDRIGHAISCAEHAQAAIEAVEQASKLIAAELECAQSVL